MRQVKSFGLRRHILSGFLSLHQGACASVFHLCVVRWHISVQYSRDGGCMDRAVETEERTIGCGFLTRAWKIVSDVSAPVFTAYWSRYPQEDSFASLELLQLRQLVSGLARSRSHGGSHRSNRRDVTAADHVVQTQRWWAKQTQCAATPLQRPAQAPRPSRRHFHEFVFRL